MTDHLRAVLVGCGSISSVWLKALEQIEGVAVVGLVDLCVDRARQRKAEFGLDRAETGDDLAAMLRVTTPDVVFDCTIPEAHAKVVLEALARGCHVLGEKPMAENMTDARRMVAAAQRAARLYAVMQNRRYDPRIRAFREVIRSGVLGELTTLHCDFFIGAHFGGFRDHMAHVLLVDMAIHTFDQARFISGVDATAVYAVEWNPKGSWYDRDASAVAVFEMQDGIVFTYRGSWCAEGLNTTWESQWRAIGTVGSASWDGAEGVRAETVEKQEGFRSRLREVPVVVSQEPEHCVGHSGCIRQFLRCVREGGQPQTICTDNIRSLAMVLGAVRSATLRRRVMLRA